MTLFGTLLQSRVGCCLVVCGSTCCKKDHLLSVLLALQSLKLLQESSYLILYVALGVVFLKQNKLQVLKFVPGVKWQLYWL